MSDNKYVAIMNSYDKQYTNFGYVLVATMVVCLLAFVAFISCEDKKQEELAQKAAERKKEIADSIAQAKKDAERNKPCNNVGKYVYVDRMGVLHTYLHCGAINDGGMLSGYTTDEDGEEVEVSNSIKCGSGVKRILLKEMDKSLLNKSCRICINDEMYEYLLGYGKKKHINIDWVSDSKADDKNRFTEDDIDPTIRKYANAKSLDKKYGF